MKYFDVFNVGTKFDDFIIEFFLSDNIGYRIHDKKFIKNLFKIKINSQAEVIQISTDEYEEKTLNIKLSKIIKDEKSKIGFMKGIHIFKITQDLDVKYYEA